ncbi:hypothetical protein NS115_03595 [Paenibacillus jamilae]|uniref:Uncharacterized protein n=1 Tax=Paenibacillus jamilae TaxID=114136 RepID=A0ACC4ZZI6_9BACL|nr:sigma-70 family RNA polymerase sigma factor [Paenibacillus jamilae]KTS84429.1 hypothetical protein NS115_03595 [Paenibacillus jamilae]
MAQLNNELINELSVMFAKTKSGEVFTDLLEQLRPMIFNEAIKAERRYGLDRNEMISEYTEDVWQAVNSDAALKFDGTSNFAQRFHTFFKKSLVDKLRYYGCEKRSAMSTVSMDNMLRPTHEMDEAFRDLHFTEIGLTPQKLTLEDELIGSDWVNETLAGFRRSNERDGLIIQLIYDGYENDEVAQALGSPTYSQNIRQVVSRAKAKFKKFIENQNPLSA